MKKFTLFICSLLLFLVGVIPIGAQDYKKCVLIETTQGEKLEYYISSNPRLTQNNDKVTLTSDVATLEFNTENIKKVYVSEANYKLVYLLDGEVYKTYYHHAGMKVPSEPSPTKSGYQFSGWINEPSTMPSHDVEVIGSFTSGINSVMVRQSAYGTGEEFLSISGLHPGGSVIVYNLSGELVQSYKASADGEVIIALSALTKGVYIIKTQSQTFKVTRK